MPTPGQDPDVGGAGWVLDAFPRGAALLAMAVGTLVLLGWALDVPVLRTFLPGVTNPMVVSTAGCFVLTGASLWLLSEEGAPPGRAWAGRTLALIAALIGLLKLSEYVFGWDLRIDQTLLTQDAGPFPGEMAIPTAASFALVGSGLVLVDARVHPRVAPTQVLVLVGALLSLFALVGRVYGAPALSSLVTGTVVMALHTAVTFLVLAGGILAARPRHGVMRLVSDAGPGGWLLRRLLPATVTIVLVGGWLRVAGENSGLYGTEFGVALHTVGSIIILSALIFVTIRSVHRSDQQRRDAEDALRSSEQRQRAVLWSIADAVMSTDREGIVMSINPAMERLAGWAAAEVLGRPYAEVYPMLGEDGQLLPPERRFLARAVEERTVVASRGFGTTLVARDGAAVPVAVTAAPILDAHGDLVGGVVVLRDVSHEREADEFKTSLVSTVSHELRTPLTMIQGFAELLLARDLGQEKSRHAVGQIHASAERLSRLIADLLSVSRIDAGRLEVHPTRVRFREVLAEVTKQFTGDREIRVAVDGVGWVLADRDRLAQILTNLVSNAVKYSPPDAPIDVTARDRGHEIRVAVADRGLGMTDEELGRLFQKFFRARRPEVRETPGTGLGLYITKSLVELHGGAIGAESEPGRGSTFWFTLPAAPGEADGSPGSRGTGAERSGMALEERT